MLWYHRTSLPRAESILPNGFSAGRSGGVDVIKYPARLWANRTGREKVWSSNDEKLRDGLWADAMLVIKIPDHVVWKNDLLRGSRRADKVARLPAQVINAYPRKLQAHQYEGDTREDLAEYAENLERGGKPKGAAAVREAIRVLTGWGLL
jgi:hypothetical protein